MIPDPFFLELAELKKKKKKNKEINKHAWYLFLLR